MTGFREHPHNEECCGQHGARRTHGHGPAGWGPGAFMFGPHGPHGPHGRGSFGPGGRNRRGMMRYLLLEALAAEPMHGYQIIQHLEERSGGMWRPSPGSVYPTLQQLDDE